MKQLLLPIVLIFFTIVCLGFIHVDNMNKRSEKMEEVKQSNSEISSENNIVTYS